MHLLRFSLGLALHSYINGLGFRVVHELFGRDLKINNSAGKCLIDPNIYWFTQEYSFNNQIILPMIMIWTQGAHIESCYISSMFRIYSCGVRQRAVWTYLLLYSIKLFLILWRFYHSLYQCCRWRSTHDWCFRDLFWYLFYLSFWLIISKNVP